MGKINKSQNDVLPLLPLNDHNSDIFRNRHLKSRKFS